MVWPIEVIVDNNALGSGDSGDIDIKIPRTRAISQLILTIRNKNGSTSNTDDDGALETIVNSISEIKLQAGSRVIKEYSGQACRDWDIYREGRNPQFFNTQIAGSTYPTGWQEAVFPIKFGRGGIPYDEICALPAPLFKSLDLKIKYDFTVDTADGFVTGSHKYDLVGEFLPPRSEAQLKNMMIIEQRKKFDDTSAASGDKAYALTTVQGGSQRLRQVMVSCYETGIAEGVDITKAEFSTDSTTRMVNDWNRLQWENAADCRLKFLQTIDSVYLDDSSHILYTEIPNVQPQMVAQDAGTEDAYLSTAGDQVTVAGAAAGENVALALHSQVIPRCIFFDFDKDGSMRELIPQNLQDIELKLTHGGADGAIEIHEMRVAAP